MLPRYERNGNVFYELRRTTFSTPKYLTVFYYDENGDKQEKEIQDGSDFTERVITPDFYTSGEYKEWTGYRWVKFSVNYKVYKLYYREGGECATDKAAILNVLREYFPSYHYSTGRDSDFDNTEKTDLEKGFEKEVVFCYGAGQYWITGKPNIRRLLTFDIQKYKKESAIEWQNETYIFYDKNIQILNEWFSNNIYSDREKNKLQIMIKRLANAKRILENKREFQQKRKYTWH